MAEKEQVEKKADHKYGELAMCVLLLVICGALFADSLRVNGIFQGTPNGPGGIPQLVSGGLILLVLGLMASLIKQGYKNGNIKEMITYLFNQDVVILLVMVILYGLLVETLHFIPTTVIFLAGTMYLLDRTKLIQKIIISVLTVAVLVLIFSTIFQVVLP